VHDSAQAALDGELPPEEQAISGLEQTPAGKHPAEEESETAALAEGRLQAPQVSPEAD
jgi:hypothetical protein